MEEIKLPAPRTGGKMSLEEAIAGRRSVRSYSGKDLTMEEVSQLLWSCQGITSKRSLRAAPSAGALYPLEAYLVKKDGFYRYVPDGHRLKKISGEDLRPALTRAAWGQGFIDEAPASIVITAVHDRITPRYGKRGIRYTDMEAGHAAENVHLQAVSLGLASVPVGAFDDAAVSKALELPENEAPLYIVPVGHEK